MSKKIIALSVCIALIAVVFVACGKDKKDPEPDTATSLEYTTDPDGNQFVTNINGELIPVTTGKDGSVELIGDLVTKTESQVEKEKEEIKKDEDKNTPDSGTPDSGNNDSDSPDDGTPDSGNNGGGNDSGKIQIGDDDVKNNNNHDAVIDWGA